MIPVLFIAGIGVLTIAMVLVRSGATRDVDVDDTTVRKHLAFDAPDLVPDEVAVSDDGRGGVAWDARGEAAVVLAFGDGLVMRRLTPPADVRVDGTALCIRFGEFVLDEARLEVAEPDRWAQRLGAAGGQADRAG